AIEIKPTENTIVISGKNGQGKTSILDSIWFALTGKDSLKNTSKPIREGEDHAEVKVNIGDYIVTRNWTSNEASYLKVENNDGAKYNSPQALLDNLIGELSFDPLEFARMDQKEQKEILLKLLNLQEGVDKLDSEYQEIFAERTFIGRNYKAAKAQFEGMTKPRTSLPEKELNIYELSIELKEALENNKAISEISHTIAAYEKDIENIEAKIKELTEQKEHISKLLVSEKEAFEKAKIIDTEAIQAKISNAESLNNEIRNAESYYLKKQAVEKLEADYKSKTGQLEKIQKAKQALILDVKMPIDGLGFDESGVTYSSIPFGQLSSAEQLKVSLSIAMAMNPRLRVIRITDGSLLDSSNMEIIKNMANENDFQVWIESVNESGEVGIYIEDGQIVKNNYKSEEVA
ncbi:MAG TPA: AAA family ATPase, partial [Candidatus Methanofastidiosum sp.]|nr:AAA family ATPase [Methanofastidiosum sp.]